MHCKFLVLPFHNVIEYGNDCNVNIFKDLAHALSYQKILLMKMKKKWY